MTWSLCMIVKDEEKNINKCLNSAHKLFDEIIIVDTGSTDKTKNIAKKYTKKIYDYEWINDFSSARNFSFSKATKDYIMWLDADDIIKSKEYAKLKKLKKTLSDDIDIVMLKYEIAHDNNANPTFTYYRERILKRTKGYKWQDKVHEYIPLTGKVIKEDITITHDKIFKGNSERNLNIYEKMEKNKETFTPRNLYYYGRELYDHRRYEKAIEVLEKFINTKKGWVEDNINSCYLISNSYYLLNLNEKVLMWLFKTFEYNTPRKKACCLIGDYFLNNKKYENAIYWYNQAIGLPVYNGVGFNEPDYNYFIPYINLCVCYYRLGDYKKSRHYHMLCKEIKPNDSIVKQNSSFFNNL